LKNFPQIYIFKKTNLYNFHPKMETKKILIDIERESHKKLRVLAATKETSVKRLVEDIISTYLSLSRP
jgi:plasmid maintenance system killer protein